jgi:phospholipase/lecithinase/hemolysin
MAITIRHHGRLLAGCAGLLLFTACGGGGGGGDAVVAAPTSVTAPGPANAPAASALTGVSRLIVAGDSLVDVGTFGFKFTVQDSASAVGNPVLPDLVAAAHGLAAGCSHIVDSGTGGVVPRGDSGCTNFAVGGGRILDGDGPLNIRNQLGTVAASMIFRAGDLLLVEGGANDASDVAAGYLGSVGSRTGTLAFVAFLARRVETGDLIDTIRGDDSLARSANLYMQEAADALADSITTNALDRGAPRVAVLNLPDLTITPRFSSAFERLVQEEGAADANAARDAVRAAIDAFNVRLQGRLGNDPRVVLVDLRTTVADQIARAALFGLTDALHAACPVTGTNSAGLPQWTLQTCTSASLDAAVPAGAAPGWWKSWAFSDGFHPTPHGHRLLADSVNRALAARGA